MTTDNCLDNLRDYIESRDSALLSDLTIHITGDDSDLEPPYIAITETGTEEHEVLRGVLTLSIDVRLCSVPVDAAQEGTATTTHRQLADELQTILSDYKSAVEFMHAQPYFSCFDVRGNAPRTAFEDGRRVTTFPLTIVCE